MLIYPSILFIVLFVVPVSVYLVSCPLVGSLFVCLVCRPFWSVVHPSCTRDGLVVTSHPGAVCGSAGNTLTRQSENSVSSGLSLLHYAK